MDESNMKANVHLCSTCNYCFLFIECCNCLLKQRKHTLLIRPVLRLFRFKCVWSDEGRCKGRVGGHARTFGSCAPKVEEFTQTRPFHVATIRLLEDRDPAEGSQVCHWNLACCCFFSLIFSISKRLRSFMISS